MALKLMYITNRPGVAKIAEHAGVDRIFVDLEFIGKYDRQKGLDTVQSHHLVNDVKKIASVLTSAEVLVRVNPIHEKSVKYISSEEEINKVIENGADIVMLPYFKSVKEVDRFLRAVDGKAKSMLLFETPEAVKNIDTILSLNDIDEVYIGLNDLSLGYGKKFMFELLADGTVEQICRKFRDKKLPFGFGGIASIGKGILPSENIIIEHIRLGSSSVILSRSFCNVSKVDDMEKIQSTFVEGVELIREFEKNVPRNMSFYEMNKLEIKNKISAILESGVN